MKLIATTALAALLACPAVAQTQNCAPRDDVIERLEKQYGEARQSIGLERRGAVMELFANNETGSWTLLVTTPNGYTCMVGAGDSYQGYSKTGKPA